MNARTDNKGFTIIEVVLVLAIAALIFLMIFVALPALQRGQANTARKNDASTVAAAVSTYRTNNSGTLPSTYAQLASYIDDLSQITIPSTGAIPDGAGSFADLEGNLDNARVYTEAKCDGNTVVDGTSKQAAVLTVLETSADNFTPFCQDV
jgi:prepilin-type N-terminal cleavage/methylation domain-containing protein